MRQTTPPPNLFFFFFFFLFGELEPNEKMEVMQLFYAPVTAASHTLIHKH